MNSPRLTPEATLTAIPHLSRDISRLGAISSALYYQRNPKVDRLDEPGRCAYPVAVIPLSRQAEKLQFQEDNLVKRRLAIARTTLRHASHQIHARLLPSAMNPTEHDVFSYNFAVNGDRIVYQLAFDRASVVREEEIKKTIETYKQPLGALAIHLNDLQHGHQDPSKIFGIDHEPNTPNASLFTFDMTGSSSLSDTDRRTWLDRLDTFEEGMLGGIERIKESGDSRTYMRYMTKDEARSTQTFKQHATSYLLPFATDLYRWHHDVSGVDTASHPLRGVIYPAWIDIQKNGGYTSAQLWQADKALGRMSRTDESLEIVQDQRDIKRIAA